MSAELLENIASSMLRVRDNLGRLRDEIEK